MMNKELLKELGKVALVSLIVVVLYNAAISKKCDCSNCSKPAAAVAEQVIDSVK